MTERLELVRGNCINSTSGRKFVTGNVFIDPAFQGNLRKTHSTTCLDGTLHITVHFSKRNSITQQCVAVVIQARR